MYHVGGSVDGAVAATSRSFRFVSRLPGFFPLRPFLMQSDLSVENGLFRLKPKSGSLTQSKKGFSTQLFSTDNSDWRIQSVEKLDFFDWILQSKSSVEKVLHMFFEPIASPIPPPNTHPHGHTTTRPYTHTRYHTAVPYKALTLAWLSLLLLLAASQRGAFLVSLASSVYHTTAAARGIDPMLPTTTAPAVALAALG